jgi:RHS repeat-associated protein
MDRMVALAQSTSANNSLKVTRAPASGRVRAHQPKPATADSRSTLASPFSIAQQNRSLLHRAATTLQPNVASRYHCNQQYSITAITSSTGAVQERYAYTAYGVPTIANASGTVLTASAYNNRYTYTGREWNNDINQYHFRARMYDPSLGRFCSRDPIGYRGDRLLYGYVRGRALNKKDPSGLVPIEFQFNAFISSIHDPDGDGWIPEPGPFGIIGYHFSTDKRLAGTPGTSRISYKVSIDSCQIGKKPPTFGGSTGATHRGIIGEDGTVFLVDTRTAEFHSNTGGTAYNCKSGWSGEMWASYPFGPPGFTPAITMGGTIDFVAGADVVTVNYNLFHDHFPDYEVLVFVNGFLVFIDPDYSQYDTPLWLGWWASKRQVGTTSLGVVTPKCCKGTCP